MKKTFSVGDRVAVYDNNERYVGMVMGFEKHLIKIRLNHNDYCRGFFPQQCRRLKKRERKVWYFRKENASKFRGEYTLMMVTLIQPTDPENWIRVREC